ncbi:MAG: hypothetical protein ACP6IY_01725 [Promethearchaeia archaeon]
MMNIHYLFILKKNGVCVYSRNFTNEFDLQEQLITPFFSAILSFSQNLISRDLEELEMSGLRFIFKIEEEFIFVILADSSVSILYISSRLKMISEIFYKFFNSLDDMDKHREIESPQLDEEIDLIITGMEDLGDVFYNKVINLFEGLIFENEIIGAALLTSKGNVIYSSLPHDILVSSLKELEIRFMTGAITLPEMFYSLENGQKVFSKIVYHHRRDMHFFIVLLFDKNIPLGMADIMLHKVGNRITKRIL